MASSLQFVPAEGPRGRIAGVAKLILSPPASWILLVYAGLVLASAWAYAGERIRVDREQSLQAARSRLIDVAAALSTATTAMFNDGVGAAVAGANEVGPAGVAGKATDAQVAATLDKMLTGGRYVRSLFIAQPGRFVRSGRGGTQAFAPEPPSWMASLPFGSASETWVGSPLPDPEQSTRSLVPIARRTETTGRTASWAGALFDFASSDALGGWVGRSVSIAGLLSIKGQVLMIVPAAENRTLHAGLDIGDSPLFKQGVTGPASGIVEGYAPRFRTEMVFAYARIPDYPVDVLVGNSLDSILSPWRERRKTTLQAAGAASAFLVLVTALLMRNLNSRRRRRMAASANLARWQEQSVVLLRLAKVGAISAGELPEVLRGVCRDALAVLAAEHVSIWLIENQEQVLRCRGRAGQSGGPPLEDASVPLIQVAGSLEALRSERVMDRASASAAVVLEDFVRSALPGQETRSLIVAAIRGSGELIGVLVAAQYSAHRLWQPDEVNFLGALADQAAHALGATEREQILADLRVVAGELMRSQDEERRRVGRELHDATGQSLAALELDLGRLIPFSDALGPERRALLESCARLARQCSSEIRTASYLLHPPMLDELGLASALRWLADGLRQRSAIDVRLDIPRAMVRLPRESELTLFRVAQEALTNVQRHSSSPWVSLRLQATPHAVQLDIDDAGRQYPPAGQPRSPETRQMPGVGLAGMRERMRQMGGTFLFESGMTGTHIRATLPMASVTEPARA